MHVQQNILSSTKDIFYRDMYNNIATGRFGEIVAKLDNKIVGYTLS